MAKKNGAQSVEVVTGRRIIVSAGVGKTNVEELKWLTDTVLAEAKAMKSLEINGLGIYCRLFTDVAGWT